MGGCSDWGARTLRTSFKRAPSRIFLHLELGRKFTSTTNNRIFASISFPCHRKGAHWPDRVDSRAWPLSFLQELRCKVAHLSCKLLAKHISQLDPLAFRICSSHSSRTTHGSHQCCPQLFPIRNWCAARSKNQALDPSFSTERPNAKLEDKVTNHSRFAMSSQAPLQHELDLDRHAGESAPDQPIPKPKLGSEFELDIAVIEGTRIYVHSISSPS